MRIKAMLNLSVGALFTIISVLTLVGAFYVHVMKKNTENILKDNYRTLEYSRNMLLALDSINLERGRGIKLFELNLNKQLANITEIGEQEKTESLKNRFNQLKEGETDKVLESQIRLDIYHIMRLNMNAIKKKSDLAKRTAEAANLWLAIAGSLCFLIALRLLVNLPRSIANPIQELTESIKQIANKNFSARVHFMESNELGDLAISFNTMAKKLEEYNNGNLYKLIFEKQRLETLINNIHDSIIGLDNQGIILFANNEALKIIGLRSEDVIGKSSEKLAETNDLIKSLIKTELENGNRKSLPMKILIDGKESYLETETVTITSQPPGEDHTIWIGNVIFLRNTNRPNQ